MPKVSVIITSYNYENYISQTIESVLNQTFSDLEVIIVDDGSKDNSIKVISKYCSKDIRVKLLTHENNQNKGLVKSLKLGISNAIGEYIVFLESDDYIATDYIQKKLDVFSQNQNTGLVLNKIKTFGNNPPRGTKKHLALTNNYWFKNNYSHNVSDVMHLFNCIPTFSCVMVKKDLFDEINFETPIKAFLDWWLWAQISTKTELYSINEELTYWRMHSDSYVNSSNNINKLNFYTQLNNILPKIRNRKILLQYLCLSFARYIKYKLIKRRV